MTDAESDPTRVVADAGVLAADVLCGPVNGDRDRGEGADGGTSNPSRAAMDVVRSHSWIDLVASDALLDDARGAIASLSTADLADAWHDRIDRARVAVDHPAGDHPGLASAYRGGAGHLLSLDPGLGSPETGAQLGQYAISVRHPRAFVRVFDAASLYAATVGGTYTGPDVDPRA